MQMILGIYCPLKLSNSRQYRRWKDTAIRKEWEKEVREYFYKIAAWQNDNHLIGYNKYGQQQRENEARNNQE